MVKHLPGDSKRDTWYRELSRRASARMAAPKMQRLFEDGTQCLISPWIQGESLEIKLASATAAETRAYAAHAAELLSELHGNTVEYPVHAQRLTEKILTACEQVEALGLTFPGHEICCAFLRREAEAHKPLRVSFVHNDVRPENFIVSKGQLYLIDFDNGGLGERASDFPYLTTIVRPEHQIFSKELTEIYLQQTDTTTFWENNLFYSALKVVDYAIWKWNTKGRQVYYQAENLMQQYDRLTSLIPRWWQKV